MAPEELDLYGKTEREAWKRYVDIAKIEVQ